MIVSDIFVMANSCLLFTLIIVVAFVVNASRSGHNHSFHFHDDVKNCTKGELLCDSCSNLVICVQVNDSFIKYQLKECGKYETCLVNQCTTESNQECDDQYALLDFPCQMQGVFPHHFYWDKYVFCVPDRRTFEAIVADCEPNYAYNPKTTFCDIPLQSVDQSQYPVPICTENGVFPLETNPVIYYECKPYSRLYPKLYPFQFTCPHGDIYHDYKCSNEEITKAM